MSGDGVRSATMDVCLFCLPGLGTARTASLFVLRIHFVISLLAVSFYRAPIGSLGALSREGERVGILLRCFCVC